jgi:F0F1-type ATP synthase assembly protein I
MAESIGELQAKITVDTSDLDKGLDHLNQKTESFGQKLKQHIGTGVQQLTQLTLTVGALGTAFTLAFAKSSIDAAADLEKTLTTLSIVAPRFGVGIEEAKESAIRLGRELRIGTGPAAEALQNLLKSGLNLEQATDLMKRFANEAITGKSNSISLADAVTNLSFAYTTSNSALGNLSGVSENFSDITERGRKSLIEQGMAKYQGMIELTNLTLGSSEKFTGSYIDKQAILAQKLQDIKIAVGQKLMPIMTKLSDLLIKLAEKALPVITKAFEDLEKTVTKVVQGATDIYNELFKNQEEFNEFAKTVAVLTLAVTGLAVAFGILTSPLFLVTATILGLSLLLTKLGISIEDVGKMFALVFNIIKLVVLVFVEFVEAGFEAIKNSIISVLENVKSIIENAFTIAKNLVGGIIDLMKGDWEGFKEKLGIVFTSIKDLLVDAFELASAPIKVVIDTILGMINGIFDKIGKVKKTFENVMNTLTYRSPEADALWNARTDELFPGRAIGGPIIPGQKYVVGEKGPEVIEAPSSGRVIKNSDLGDRGSLGGGSNINININGGNYDANTLASLVQNKLSLQFNTL